MKKFIQIFTTADTKETAEKIADVLVEKKLAACVQMLGPIRSVYRWKGAVEKAEEWLCLIKSRKSLFTEIEAAIKEVHPYDVPEIIALPLTAGSGDYLAWLSDCLKRRHFD